jgi:branched-chain amino acid transport system permease protein
MTWANVVIQGVNAFRAKFTVHVIAALGCGITGAVIYLNLLRLQPDATFSVNWTAYMIFAVIIGGVGSIEGPIIGAALFTVLQQTLSGYGAWYLVALGMVAILVTVWARRGLWGAVSDRLGSASFRPDATWTFRQGYRKAPPCGRSRGR